MPAQPRMLKIRRTTEITTEPDGLWALLDTARLGPAMLEQRDPPLKVAWVERGNPVTQNPQTHTVLEAFRALDFRVVVEQFLTDYPNSERAGYFAEDIINYYSRDLGLFPLEEAVRRMTSLSAAEFGLVDRHPIRHSTSQRLVEEFIRQRIIFGVEPFSLVKEPHHHHTPLAHFEKLVDAHVPAGNGPDQLDHILED